MSEKQVHAIVTADTEENSEIILNLDENKWVMKIDHNGTFHFNREEFPNASTDDFALSVLNVLENERNRFLKDKMSAWNPMETAPKSHYIILYDKGAYIGCWGEANGEPSWVISGTCIPISDPSHWMPLPERPKD